MKIEMEHLLYTIILEDFILDLGAQLSPTIVPYITPGIFPILTTGAIIACYAFTFLVVLEILKRILMNLMNDEHFHYPYLEWGIDGLCILSSQIGGIYMASLLLKEAFLPLLFCSFIGSMAVLQTAMIAFIFYMEAMEYFYKAPEVDNRLAFMYI